MNGEKHDALEDDILDAIDAERGHNDAPLFPLAKKQRRRIVRNRPARAGT